MFDSTNQIMSNPPAWKMRLFTCATLDCCYIFQNKISELPAGAKKAHMSCAQGSCASIYLKTKISGVEAALLVIYFHLYTSTSDRFKILFNIQV
jgi:hypothetical protein